MAPSIELQRFPIQHYVGIQRRVNSPEIGAACAEVLPATAKMLLELGIAPLGAEAVFYHAHLEHQDLVDLQPGYFVADPVPAEPPFSTGSIPACQAAVLVHEGPYDRLVDSHAAIQQWVSANGRRPLAPCWESYLVGPSTEPDPAKWRTLVAWPLV